MLTLNGDDFASGVAQYYDVDPNSETKKPHPSPFIHIEIELGGGVEIPPIFARVDTAAPWVILNSELNKQIGFQVNSTSEPIRLQTAVGEMEGYLEQFPIKLLANEGDSLEIEATLFVCDNWDRENFLGYSGFLQRFRFAVEPNKNMFYFGMN